MKPPNNKTPVKQQSHAMRREIYEQPEAIAKTIQKHLRDDTIFP